MKAVQLSIDSKVLLGGLLAIIGGILVQVYQARYAREQIGIQLRFKEQEDATAALKEIGALADAPISRALSVLDAVLDGRISRFSVRFRSAHWVTHSALKAL